MSKLYTVLLLRRDYPGGGGGTADTTPGGTGQEGATQLAVGYNLELVAERAMQELRVIIASLIHARLPEAEANAWDRPANS